MKVRVADPSGTQQAESAKMNSIAWIENHRRSLLFVAFTLALAGVFAAVSLPVGLFPVTSFPRIRIEIEPAACRRGRC